MTSSPTWFLWALMSAAFAALTAIFAKVGIKGVDSDLAASVRTLVILVVRSGFVWFAGKWSNPLSLPSSGPGSGRGTARGTAAGITFGGPKPGSRVQ